MKVKKAIIAMFAMFVVLAGVCAAGGHIRSQRMNCRQCKCTYFTHDRDYGSHCYCSCGHAYQAHSR